MGILLCWLGLVRTHFSMLILYMCLLIFLRVLMSESVGVRQGCEAQFVCYVDFYCLHIHLVSPHSLGSHNQRIITLMYG